MNGHKGSSLRAVRGWALGALLVLSTLPAAALAQTPPPGPPGGRPRPTPEMRQARQQILWEADDRIHEVLSCEQREQLRRLRREMHATP